MDEMRDTVLDPELTQKVTRIQRIESIDEYGRPVLKLKRTSIYGVVTSATAGDINRFVDATTYTKGIRITTAYELLPDNTSGQADVIEFRGNHYEVLGVDDYSRFGYNRAVCALIEFQVDGHHGK